MAAERGSKRSPRPVRTARATAAIPSEGAGWGWRRRHVGVFLVAGCLGALVGSNEDVDLAAPNPSSALATALSRRGFSCTDADVSWVTPSENGFFSRTGRAFVRASVNAEPSDLYLVRAKLSPEGVVLAVLGIWNLTETTGVDESRALVFGHTGAFTTGASGVITAVHTVDIDGRKGDADWTQTQRWQLAISNLQQTGQTSGIVHNTFSLDPVAENVEMTWGEDGKLSLTADGRAVTIDVKGAKVPVGEAFVRVSPDFRAKPGNVVTWAVDRVRAIPWFGDEKMQWVKAIAFTALDWVHERTATETTASQVREELGAMNAGAEVATFIDPEVGWPPPPLKPILSSPLPGEGGWIDLKKDPFITQVGAARSAFVTSFIRPNPKRPDLRVYITLWDPRQIALHMQSGTVEPVSSTGEHGLGIIPRSPKVLSKVVAAFNGGFQAQHGEFGMQADGVVFLPPKPYGATVAELADGSAMFGTWPESTTIPGEMVSFRQNLTALVQFDKLNPWGRSRWGGTPPGWADNIHSTRSAICLTKENFIGYFWSASIEADDLGQALLAARCTYGIHLDMNPGHAGFEFYDVEPSNEYTKLTRPLQADWEGEGKVSGIPDFSFRSRRMIRSMGHMNFPRYIQREGRDFFYLTARPLIPGRPLPPLAPTGDTDEGRWHEDGLPQHGFPYAIATSSLRIAGSPRERLRFLRVDPRMVRPVASADTKVDAPTVVAFTGAGRATSGEWSLAYAGSAFSISPEAVPPGATPLAVGVPPTDARGASSRAAVGIGDDDGLLTWVELEATTLASAETAKAMTAALDRAGCSVRMLIPGTSRALLGGTLDITGQPPPPLPARAGAATAINARLVRVSGPAAHLGFETTPLVPPSVWQPLQAKRSVYLHAAPPGVKPAAAASSRPDAGGVSPESSPNPPLRTPTAASSLPPPALAPVPAPVAPPAASAGAATQ